jgi:hypothetical protein
MFIMFSMPLSIFFFAARQNPKLVIMFVSRCVPGWVAGELGSWVAG